MGTVERLVRYAKVSTASKHGTGTRPSTKCQLVLAGMLQEEMDQLGISRARVDGMGYVYGEIPATAGCEDAPAIGFIAHIDTAPDFSGENVNPRVIENYDGGDVELGAGRVLRVSEFPHLAALKGDTIVVTDGTTLLGADDKAAIAVLLTAAEKLLASGQPHGKVCFCFNPDEEIGEGAWDLDVDELGADYAYTLDGEHTGEIIYECFNASRADISIRGFNVHPGQSKGLMINAGLVAAELLGMLPPEETPRHTAGYEGFFHLNSISGTTERAHMNLIVRDFDRDAFLAREKRLYSIVAALNEKYGAGTVTMELREQYSNMAEEIKKHFHLVENAMAAIRDCGIEPRVVPLRGGTDGAQLTVKKGLPCPDLGEGGFAFHGPYEHASQREMDATVDIVLGIIQRYAQPGSAPKRTPN